MMAPRNDAGLEYFTPAGDLVAPDAGFEPELRVPARDPVTARHAVVGGRSMIQYRLPRSARRDQRARAALEREAAAALAIEQAYGDRPYGALFTRFVGYNLDAAEPFVLYAATQAPGAEPLSRCAGLLGVEQLRTVMTQLTLVARLLDHVGFVHRALTPQTVWWDERKKRVRVAEPHSALPAGAPREPQGPAPWASPEQHSGKGTADPRDDLWSVMQLTYHLASGRHPDGTGPPPDLASHRQLAALRDSGVFAYTAAQRPPAAEVLKLLGKTDPLAGVAGAPDPLDVHREEFDRLLADKRRDHAETATRGPGSRPDGDSGDRESQFITRNGWTVLRDLKARKGDDR